MFSLICAWINGWVNNREAGDLRRHRAHYDVIVMRVALLLQTYNFTTRGCYYYSNGTLTSIKWSPLPTTFEHHFINTTILINTYCVDMYEWSDARKVLMKELIWHMLLRCVGFCVRRVINHWMSMEAVFTCYNWVGWFQIRVRTFGWYVYSYFVCVCYFVLFSLDYHV